MDSNLRCDEAVLASSPPPPPRGREFDRVLVSSETLDNLHSQDNYEDVDPNHPNLIDFFIPHFIKAYRDRVILDDARVFSIMLALEEWYIPDTDLYYCSSHQNEIKLHMRKIVADWMLDVCVDQRCQVNVFLLATNIMDRFLGTIALRKKQFQLLGAASIFLASKMIEPTPVSATTLVKCTADTYDREELLSMELLILSKLKWDVTAITAYDYLDHLLNALKKSTYTAISENIAESSNSYNTNESESSFYELLSSDSLKRNAEKLILLCATDYRFANLPPSTVASAALMSAIQQEICQCQRKWTSRLTSSTSFSTNQQQGNNILERGSTSSSSFLKHININQIIARLQLLMRVETDNLKLCINLIEQLFIIPLSNDNATNQSTNSATNAADALSTLSKTTTNINSTTPFTLTPETSFEQQQQQQPNKEEEGSNLTYLNSHRSPPTQTPPSSPPPFSSTPSSLIKTDNILLSSSPPRASSSPISLHANISTRNIQDEEALSSYCLEQSSSFSSESYSNLTKSKRSSTSSKISTTPVSQISATPSASIEGLLTIRPVSNKTNEVALNEASSQGDNDDISSDSSRRRKDISDRLNTGNFADIGWNSQEETDSDKNAAGKQAKSKNGDTPTEVFKVSALYVT